MKLSALKNMRTSDSSFFSGNTQPTTPNIVTNVYIEKINYLETENKQIKQEMSLMKNNFKLLKSENDEIKKLLKQNNIQYGEDKTDSQMSSTFVTQGAANPTSQCDNCSKEIDKSKMRLHMAYCLKNTKKCQFCAEPCDGEQGMQKHISENTGSYEEIQSAIENYDIDALDRYQKHQSNKSLNDVFLCENNKNGNSVIQYSILQTSDIQRLKNLIDLFIKFEIDINKQNKNGETALHLAAKQENLEITKYLVLKCKANTNIKNSLGDTALSLAIRGKNHELIMVLNSLHEQVNFAVRQNSITKMQEIYKTPVSQKKNRSRIRAENKPPLPTLQPIILKKEN